MIDRHEARVWADQHQAFSAWAGRLFSDVRGSFNTLARIQYAAPWQAVARADARNGAASRTGAPALRCPA